MIIVRGATASDVDAIADLHLLAFPDYFLSHLGKQFLRLFYASFLTNETSHCIIAVDSDRIIGFVAGTSDEARHYITFYRRKLAQIVFIVGIRFLQEPVIRREIFRRAGYWHLALAALLRPGSPPSATRAKGNSQVLALLQSIAVHPDYRGRGVAENLTDSLVSQLRRDGACRVGLAVRRDNARAIAFYKKDGWIVERVTSDSLHFIKT